MKTFVTLSMSLVFLLFQPSTVKATYALDNGQLSRQIENIVKNSKQQLIEADTEEVTVHFVINAQNELVIFDATGKNASTCEHVKEVLNYKQVRYKQGKQLTPYTINIRFVKNAG